MAYTSLSKKDEEEEELHKKEMTRLESDRDRKLDILDKQVHTISLFDEFDELLMFSFLLQFSFLK